MSPTKAGKEIGGKARFAGLPHLAQVLANSLLSEQLTHLPGDRFRFRKIDAASSRFPQFHCRSLLPPSDSYAFANVKHFLCLLSSNQTGKSLRKRPAPVAEGGESARRPWFNKNWWTVLALRHAQMRCFNSPVGVSVLVESLSPDLGQTCLWPF